ncbi:UDP-N-acetylglucosamine transferase subunit ALG14 [Hypsizygus marmoreus]|uniref:UDP-N-acetylglucosamine transferase subunit ALG14 n=1 Tax=Hypsizygus marmoreus TaxID=39966 RepID=A0A369K0G6_HYPMA|nr:UDP-N-acetylglucosamine transferase subunit ALG14 [Hypsizygus marmoreus]
MLTAFLICLIALGLLLRFYLILPSRNPDRSRKTHLSESCSLAVFLGSGGHTSEALALVSALDFSRYTSRTYIVSEGDNFSAQKASALELVKAAKNASPKSGTYQHSILTVPRARRVHQSLLTTPPTAAHSLMTCLYYVMIAPQLLPKGGRPIFADVLLLNGPGTCFVLCIAVYVTKFLGLPAPQIIYVESFARVQHLSLSGKLLRPLVDRFVVQWPHLLQDRGRGECRGWLV